MSRPDTIAIVNERAGAGAMADTFRRLEHDIEAIVGGFDVAFTDYPGHATELARDALLDGYARILVGGGDGTVHEVVNGWFDADGRRLAEDARLALITGGTGGDFRKSVGARTREDALRLLKEDRVRPIDVGRVRFVDPEGHEASRYFVNIASFGLSGETVRRIPSFKRFGGNVAYVGATLRAMWGWRNPVVRLTLDGEPGPSGPMSTVAVGNGRYFGGGMMVCAGAELDDGHFTVAILGDMSRFEMIGQTAAIRDGKHVNHPKVSLHDARSVVAEADTPVYLDVDGEALGVLPARFEILPAALPMVR
ncbi:MAG: diacylglycerol kinase family lipid kinase [Deltaproteobacteria bacterium]|nr:MAG: diacylglycerol kinase family lipid kinase [Deltaproteobacteria bacterium]